MLRIIPLLMAFIHGYISPNLTEKDKSKAVWSISPLSDPGEFDQAASLASVVSFEPVICSCDGFELIA